jgi:hypothetical protein
MSRRAVGHGWRSYVSELFDRLTPYVSESRVCASASTEIAGL